MSNTASYDLNELVDNQKMNLRSLVFLVLALLILVSDGFDLAVMGYVGPELVKAWGIAPAQLVPAFSAGIIGMLVGGAGLGMLGDSFGRKRVIIAGLLVIGVSTLATMMIRSVTDLIVLRFITGIGIGGVIPNVVALVAEAVPRRIRGRVIVAVAMGVALGISVPGLTSAILVPRFGWQSVLFVGGALPIAVALASIVLLPESIKFLVAKGNRHGEAITLLRAMRPELAIDDRAVITLPASGLPIARGSIAPLFAGSLLFITPLLWACQAANQMANFFALTWLPMLLQASGATTAEAGIAASLFSLGGLLSGLVLILVVDRLGTLPLMVMFLVGAPMVAMIATPDLPPLLHYAVITGAGLCVTGIQLGITALLGVLYPTEIRSRGTGWTQAVGRIGALAAPIVGGILLEMQVPAAQLPMAPALLLALGGVCCGLLAFLCFRHFGGMHVDEFTTSRSPPADPGVAEHPAATSQWNLYDQARGKSI